jgi:hypothetical protein
MKDKWLRFKDGFVSVWKRLYAYEENPDWYAQVGLILGVVTLVGLWLLIGKGMISILTWMVT